jgi:hypothetical protein
MPIHSLNFSLAMKTILTSPNLRRLIYVLCCGLLLQSDYVSAQVKPLKDLRKGNIFYYFVRRSSAYFGHFFEKVVGDTVIQGRSYAKVYSDPWYLTSSMRRLPRLDDTSKDTIRFERATDSALYEWVPKENKEYTLLRHIPAYKSRDRFYLRTPIFDCSSGCSVGLDLRITGFDWRDNNNPSSWEFISQIGSGIFIVGYAFNTGNIDISNNANNQTRRDFNLVGTFRNNEILPYSGSTINFIQQLDTLLQTSRITVGVREQQAAHSLSLAPNPVSDEAEVRFSLVSSKRVRLALVDNLGRVLLSIADEQLPSGEHRFPVRTEALANGVYWVRLFTDVGVQNVPLIVRR